jgi:hypothetical protein
VAAAAQVPFTRFLNVSAAVEIGTVPKVFVNALKDDGLFVEWKIKKTNKSEADTMELSIYNLPPDVRKSIQAYASKPPGIPTLDYQVRLSIGWDGQVMQVFKGRVKHVEAERSAKAGDRKDAITFLRVLDGVEKSDIPKGDGTNSLAAAGAIIAKHVGILKIGPLTSKQIGVIAKAAKKLPLDFFRVAAGGTDPKKTLDAVFETLNLSWSIQNGKIVIYDRGINSEALHVVLNPQSGLLTYEVKDDGNIKIKALANPAVLPGGPVTVYDKDNQVVTGAPLRVEKVEFEGDTESKSLMTILGRKPTVGGEK